MAVLSLALWAGGWVAGLAQPYGLSNRVANTTLRLPPNPPMPPSYSYATTNAPGARADEDFDLDGDLNNLEYLIGSDPTSPADRWAGVGIERQNDTVEVTYHRVPNRGFEVQVTTNPTAPAVWQPLNIPENAPAFSAQPQSVRVPDTITNAPAKFYRVRVFQP